MRHFSTFFALVFFIMLSACNDSQTNTPVDASVTITASADTLKPLVNEVLTQAQRDAMKPDDIIQMLKDGNGRYTRNDLTKRDHSDMVRKSAAGQFPKAVILSCLDSRVPVEDVFDRGIGDIFVGRVAGNFVNEDLLGSMEFGCKVAGAKLILVMGHEHCGAVKSAIDDVKLGNITAMLSKIRPAVNKTVYTGDRTSRNDAFVHLVCENNVKGNIEQIRAKSAILKEMEAKGEIKIIGAVYNLETGDVEFLQ